MTLERSELSGPTAKPVAPQSLLPSTLPMSQDGSTPPAQRAHPGTRSKREFSWQVATNLFTSFKYAWAGISYAFQTQRNFRIHVIIGTVAIGLSVYLQLSFIEIAVIILTIGAVLGMELLNTALESVVDLSVEQKYHELAKIAKDCAAGAVLISALAAISVAACLLIPPLIERLQSMV